MKEYGKILIGPEKQKRKKFTMNNQDGILRNEEELRDLNLYSKVYDVKDEKDLESIDCMFIELESLINDLGGVDYEQMLEGIEFNSLIRGITTTPLLTEISKKSDNMTENDIQMTMTKEFTNSENLNLRKKEKSMLVKIEELEKEAALQTDYKKKIIALKKIDDLIQKTKTDNTKLMFIAMKKNWKALNLKLNTRLGKVSRIKR